jgi:hypothetical protein
MTDGANNQVAILQERIGSEHLLRTPL